MKPPRKLGVLYEARPAVSRSAEKQRRHQLTRRRRRRETSRQLQREDNEGVQRRAAAYKSNEGVQRRAANYDNNDNDNECSNDAAPQRVQRSAAHKTTITMTTITNAASRHIKKCDNPPNNL